MIGMNTSNSSSSTNTMLRRGDYAVYQGGGATTQGQGLRANAEFQMLMRQGERDSENYSTVLPHVLRKRNRGHRNMCTTLASLCLMMALCVCAGIVGPMVAHNADVMSAFYQRYDVPPEFMGEMLPTPCPKFGCWIGRLWIGSHAASGFATFLLWMDGGVAAHRVPFALFGCALGMLTAFVDIEFGFESIMFGCVWAWMTLVILLLTCVSYYNRRGAATLFLMPLLGMTCYCVAFATAVNNNGRREQPAAQG